MSQPQQPGKILRWRDEAEKRIAYLAQSEKNALKDIDGIPVNSHARSVSWAFIHELGHRKNELQDLLKKVPAEALSAPASPVEEKSRLEDQAEYAKWILDVINDELSDAGNNDSLSCRLAFEFQAHLDAVYEGAAEWESKYKEAQIKLDKLTESKPSPVIPQRVEDAIAFAKWINNSWYTPHYSKWIHLREGLAGTKTAEELWDLFQQSKQNKDGK